jgi:hypothetical protein
LRTIIEAMIADFWLNRKKEYFKQDKIGLEQQYAV